ncbi:hypothetical protein HD_1225 [[Haemophilus] ducreyi 35000HP]|uniref:Uncharacterized protein n=1 Tax=Haemophilus ducreyi (strain 35000HP / ATCC 700724) TaxID=233412 RepID=Q7VM04_HAEDU|nr:hypothetical protein HD_1225 [[Haemophilus] ducreyi 35000HP]
MGVRPCPVHVFSWPFSSINLYLAGRALHYAFHVFFFQNLNYLITPLTPQQKAHLFLIILCIYNLACSTSWALMASLFSSITFDTFSSSVSICSNVASLAMTRKLRILESVFKMSDILFSKYIQ